MIGQISYYKNSLKIGVDCRDSGLGWILKKLRSLLNGNTNNDKESSVGGAVCAMSNGNASLTLPNIKEE